MSLRASQLRRLAGDHPGRGPWDLVEADLSAWLGSHDWARETLRSHRAALRSFYGWAAAAGHVEDDPARLLRRVPAAEPAPRPAAEQVIRPAIVRADDRAALMLRLGAQQGLRRGEISRI